MGNLLGPISRRRRREQLFPTRDAAGCEDSEHVPRPSRARENRRHPLDRETNPGATSAAPPRWSEAAPTKSWHRDSCGKDRALPAGQTEAHSFGPVPAGGGQRRHGQQQRHWPQKNAASGKTENREGKPASGSLQAPAVPVHFRVHTTGRWRAIPPSGRNFAFLRPISTPEPG